MSVFVRDFWLKVSKIQLEQAYAKDKLYWKDTGIAYKILKR